MVKHKGHLFEKAEETVGLLKHIKIKVNVDKYMVLLRTFYGDVSGCSCPWKAMRMPWTTRQNVIASQFMYTVIIFCASICFFLILEVFCMFILIRQKTQWNEVRVFMTSWSTIQLLILIRLISLFINPGDFIFTEVKGMMSTDIKSQMFYAFKIIIRHHCTLQSFTYEKKSTVC